MQVQDLLFALKLGFPSVKAWDAYYSNDGCDSIEIKAKTNYYVFFNQELEGIQANYTLMPCYMYGSLELTTESVHYFYTLEELFNHLARIL